MNEKKRSALRALSKVSAGVGFFMALGAAGTSDFRDELKCQDEETYAYHESNIISEQTERRVLITALAMMGVGVFGLAATGKQR